MLGHLSLDCSLEENCELRGTDNVQRQISGHIFAPEAIVFIIPQTFGDLDRGVYFDREVKTFCWGRGTYVNLPVTRK